LPAGVRKSCAWDEQARMAGTAEEAVVVETERLRVDSTTVVVEYKFLVTLYFFVVFAPLNYGRLWAQGLAILFFTGGCRNLRVVLRVVSLPGPVGTGLVKKRQP
jgi:hypothetical protein